ncbi:MAG: DEAD/DEAH box helicase, partial [Acidobacteriota bacterium]
MERYLATCLQLDLETTRHDPPRLRELGARRLIDGGAQELRLTVAGAEDDLSTRLDEFSAGCARVLGHNVVEHDLPVLDRVCPDLRLLSLPVVDTLMLSPLAFPRVPYHALVKDYRLTPDAVSDPVADARLAARLFRDEWKALAEQAKTAPDLVPFYAACLAEDHPGTADALKAIGGRRLSGDAARAVFGREAAAANCCRWSLDVLLDDGVTVGPELAYAVAWLRVAETGSVSPPWVRYRYPRLPGLLDTLRHPRPRLCRGDTGRRADCRLCVGGWQARDELRRVFGFEAFRPEPPAADGSSLQEQITAAGLDGRPLLAILATGAGKSICYQLPALVHHRRRGQLTIVVSPLQALMRDQVEGLRRRVGGERAAALYGLLTPLERGKVLERVRLGEIAVLYVAPEQLRNRSFLQTVAQREIAAWVYDEAHCLSKWGHDFRPDYLYVARCIWQIAEHQQRPVPPVACFTATAKADVIAEIRHHLRETLGHEVELFAGPVDRAELHFRVESTPPPRKL